MQLPSPLSSPLHSSPPLLHSSPFHSSPLHPPGIARPTPTVPQRHMDANIRLSALSKPLMTPRPTPRPTPLLGTRRPSFMVSTSPLLSSLDALSLNPELKRKITSPRIAPVNAPPPASSPTKSSSSSSPKKKWGDEEWNCGGIMCSYRCIYNAFKGIFTKQGWLRTWWRGTGALKYLSREEFEESLNSYAELLRLLDFYVAQRESGQIEAKDMSKVKDRRKRQNMKLQSLENAERQDQYLEAFLTGLANTNTHF